jgi:aspartate racemase
MATSGTIRSELYQRALTEHGAAAVLPTPTRQHEVMAAIRSIKAGVLDSTVSSALESVAADLARSGAASIIAACSEILLSMSPDRVPVAVVDPVQAVIDELLDGLAHDAGWVGEQGG